MAELAADPLNEEGQRLLYEEIQRENIEQNMHHAIEHTPEVFGRVIMLYIDTTINNIPIKTFVDTGAQQSIMTAKCAERCGLMRLLDKRFHGVAKGVGTAKILGRVHAANIKIGNSNFSIALSILDNPSQDTEFILGLDMLKRHQCMVNLKKDCLEIGEEHVPFLAEKDLKEILGLDESLPENYTPPTNENNNNNNNNNNNRPSSTSSTSSTSNSSPTTNTNIRNPVAPTIASPPSAQTQATPTFPEESIGMLMSLGASRQKAIQLLTRARGNVDQAASLFFGINSNSIYYVLNIIAHVPDNGAPVVRPLMEKLGRQAFHWDRIGDLSRLAVSILLNRKDDMEPINKEIKEWEEYISYTKLPFQVEIDSTLWDDHSKDGKVPFNKLRDHLKNNQGTRKLLESFRAKSKLVYLSLIDSDTVDFNFIYESYDRIISERIRKQKEPPLVISTGYKFDAKKSEPLELACTLDRSIRIITCKHLPFGAYYPEPNTIILARDDPPSFICPTHPTKRETSSLIYNLMVRHNLFDQFKNGKEIPFLFVDANPLITTIPERVKKAGKKIISTYVDPHDIKDEDFELLKGINQSHANPLLWHKCLFINSNYVAWKQPGSTLSHISLFKPFCNLALHNLYGRPLQSPKAESEAVINQFLHHRVAEGIYNILKEFPSLTHTFHKVFQTLRVFETVSFNDIFDSDPLLFGQNIGAIDSFSELLSDGTIDFKDAYHLHQEGLDGCDMKKLKQLLPRGKDQIQFALEHGSDVSSAIKIAGVLDTDDVEGIMYELSSIIISNDNNDDSDQYDEDADYNDGLTRREQTAVDEYNADRSHGYHYNSGGNFRYDGDDSEEESDDEYGHVYQSQRLFHGYGQDEYEDEYEDEDEDEEEVCVPVEDGIVSDEERFYYEDDEVDYESSDEVLIYEDDLIDYEDEYEDEDEEVFDPVEDKEDDNKTNTL
ncbi:hypothetical protein DFA_07352 [Cavenderia fasciculata]|uniref:UBA domain-containing protein n=1 Tax=Cavenderia fasciculata TaxID=261658 RepID=F4PW67_CACFS|nr:uncharacterized protein DFA_07352 [Cavenderia fasciculata]EGG20231.1 hypothetical protein DFA_07352 [Cavenderia fasciculata]|eukprot:XP_004367214.1 hypothetical protein DFA_07352 [Cavenderia fasciculata]